VCLQNTERQQQGYYCKANGPKDSPDLAPKSSIHNVKYSYEEHLHKRDISKIDSERHYLSLPGSGVERTDDSGYNSATDILSLI